MLKKNLQIIILLSPFFVFDAFSKEKVPTANEALTCTPSSSANKFKGNCPYPFDVAKVDPSFKRAYNDLFKNKEVNSIDGPVSEFTPVEINGKRYLSSNFCQQHMCSEIRFDYLYLPSQAKIVGVYRNEVDAPGKVKWIGNPSEAEKKELLGR